MQRHSDATLNGMTKKQLIEYVRMCEHNYDIAEETLRQQAENVKGWRPVKHGRWSECWRDPERNVISVICSACENASLTYLPKKDLDVDDVPKKICIQMPYCPKCGARMEVDDMIPDLDDYF